LEDDNAVQQNEIGEQMNVRSVVCAAIRNPVTGLVICGPRHHHCFLIVSKVFEELPKVEWEQGFVDQFFCVHESV